MNQRRGFTLIEVTVAIVSSAVLMLIISVLITMINQHFFQTRDRLASEESAARAEYLLKAFFSQAINVRGAYDDPTWNLGDVGQVVDDFEYDQIADAPGLNLLAAFPREVSHGAGDDLKLSKFLNTAIWYHSPDATSGTAGVIFISSNTNGAALDAGYGQEYIDRISYLKFVKHPTPTGKLASIDVTLKVRYHMSYNGVRNWCPQADTGVIAGCNANAPWMDTERTFNVLLRNNLLKAKGSLGGSVVTSEERVLGNLYFFQPFLPAR